MRLHLALLPACWLLWPQAAAAEPIRLTCQVVIEASGQLEQRSVQIDPDNRVVRDNAMTFTDGATSPLAKNIEEFVTVEGHRATWGSRTKLDRKQVGVFTIDLLTGQYTFVTRSLGQFSHGFCRRTDEAA